MTDLRRFLQDSIASLKQQRDELAVQMHLGKAELREEWDKMRAKLDKLNDDYEPVREAMGESAEQVVESLKLVAGEIKDGFQRIRKSMQSS
jgi:uncharacterized coiled-coil DUF342 family protein